MHHTGEFAHDRPPAMRFSILGPLQVFIDNKPVKLGKSRQLTVLALLLVSANKLVPVSRLIHAVWGGNPPVTVDKQIQTCVWRLRNAFELAGASGGLIETGPGGYVLRLPEGALDAHVFEDLVRRGRERTEAGDLEGAVTDYRAALGLFQGAPLAELTSPVIQAVTAQWDERRLTVLEERLDLELALGRRGELVSELKMLVAEYPLREQLRAQLMTALYLSQRRADALAVYRVGRATLVNNLGLEPGARLQELHRRIIAGDSIPATAHEPARVSVKPPAQLPADIADFTGRVEEQSWIERELTRKSTGSRVVALVGLPGAGKTALAIHAAHAARETFTDGQLFADLRGSTSRPVQPIEVLRGFLRALGVSDQNIAEDLASCAAQFRSAISGRRVLVVLDDAPNAAWLKPFLPGCDNCAVLITASVSMLELPGVASLRLTGLAADDAVQLLTSVAGKERVAADRVAAQAVVHRCGYLPLAIRAAGARLQVQNTLRLNRFVERLADEDRRITELTYGTLDLGARLARTVSRLPDGERDLWLSLSLTGLTQFPSWAASVAADVPDHQVQYWLDDLVDHQLLENVGEDVSGVARYSYHPLVRVHARRFAHTDLDPTMRAGAVRRVGEVWTWLTAYAKSVLEHRNAMPDPQPILVDRIGWTVLRELSERAAEWLKQEHTNLERVRVTGHHDAQEGIKGYDAQTA